MTLDTAPEKKVKYICGMNNAKIWLSSPHMGGDEIKFIQEAFDTNWISPVGPHIEGFEKDLCAYNKIEHCAVVSSGTAAIHLALIILGVQQGDEVICSTFTFSGSCNPIMYQKAVPVFVDSESLTWNMDPDLLEEAIKARIREKGVAPKAIIPVHLYGMPAQMKRIMAIAAHYNIAVIEDAAEALGSTLHEQPLGSFGDFGIYSFNGNKIITTSGGGALVSKNAAWIAKSKFLATQARDEAPHYQHSEVGYNYRMSNISAGIGRGQMRVLNDRVTQRRAVHDHYLNELPSGIFKFLPEPVNHFSNRWLTTVQIAPKDGISSEKIRIELAKQNIESRPLWKPMHLQPVFEEFPAYVNGTSEALFNAGLCLPSGSNLTTVDLNRVVMAIRGVTSR